MTTTALATPEEPRRRKAARGRRKRSNGEGSIWPRSDGRYGYAAYVLTNAGTYKRIQGYARSSEEARKKLTELIRQSDQGIPAASENWTVAEYLIYWLRHVVQEERRPKTYQGYEGAVRLHIIPCLGKKRLGKLTAREIRVFITSVREQCQCCKHGLDAARDKPRCCALAQPQCCQLKLSTRMVQSIHAVLRNALECAVREEIIPRNVAKLVKVSAPTYKVNRGLTVNQARRALAAAEDEHQYALYVLALCLGLRRGELLGLRWVDVDLDAGTLEVVQSLQRVGGQLRFVRPKTDDSERTVPLPEICTEAFADHFERQQIERADAEDDWQDHGLVFPSRIGTPMEPDNLRRSWARICAKAGLDATRLHDTRH